MPQQHAASSYSRFFSFLFPFIGWLRTYSLALCKKDLNAGFTVALVLIPQSMANAQLAGLPAYHGLYAALLPTFIGGLWGSSRQMVTGSVAVTCLMAAAALQPLAIHNISDYIAYMALLTLLVGGIQLLFGAARMGFLVNFLSLPVISGFTNAAALIIVASQLGKLIGVTVDGGGPLYQTVLATASSAWNYTHWPSVLMAGLAVGTLFLCRRFAPKAPAVLAAIALTTLCSWAFSFEATTTAHITDIASDEARILLVRLVRQEQEVHSLSEQIAALQPAGNEETAAETLEATYKAKELQLEQANIQANMRLVREHLRRMLFVAEEKKDGARVFHVKQSPRLVFTPPPPVIATMVTPAPQEPQPPLAETQAGQGAPDIPAANGTGQANATAPQPQAGETPLYVQESSLPAETFADGRTWRLRLGNKMPNLEELNFSSGGAVVGEMASGLPVFQMPEFSSNRFFALLPTALIIAFVGFAESISIGKAAATQRGYRIDANQEMVGQGLANIAGGLTLTSPVSGSFSNSAVNLAAGARTGMAAVFASAVTLFILLFLSGVLRYLPQPVLAVVVIRAAYTLFHPKVFVTSWKAQRIDGVIALITFGATLFFAPHLNYGILLGVVLSLAAFFYRSMRPAITILAVGQDHMLHDAKALNLISCHRIAVVQFQGPLFFANASVLENNLLDRLEHNPELQHIHLVCSGITHMDASGEDALETIVERAYRAGVGFSISGVVGAVAAMLERTGLIELIGAENVYFAPREALCVLRKDVKHCTRCEHCPLDDLFCGFAEEHPLSGKCGLTSLPMAPL
ncbi:SulP family inorganic anion transporter [Desulfovibrio cuneatus]|uniref:SulP family inorganic anion transporter n=1 Tax=Desulfovibrio cuneatus TaxID=159728 RepID=UPI0006863B27|nr:SulP family inorganic anion transporter [Desulfovibrio cuneatus]